MRGVAENVTFLPAPVCTLSTTLFPQTLTDCCQRDNMQMCGSHCIFRQMIHSHRHSRFQLLCRSMQMLPQLHACHEPFGINPHLGACGNVCHGRWSLNGSTFCKHTHACATHRPLSPRPASSLTFVIPLFDDYVELPDTTMRVVQVAMLVCTVMVFYNSKCGAYRRNAYTGA